MNREFASADPRLALRGQRGAYIRIRTYSFRRQETGFSRQGRRDSKSSMDQEEDAYEAEAAEREAEPQASDEFPCDQCGASMTWSPDTDSLSCAFCGNSRELLRSDETIVERALGDAESAERGLGVDLRVAECDTCGARVSFEGHTTADCCVYCGSANVLAQEANRRAIRPESLVPLDVGKQEVEQNFRKWIQGLWFRPNALKQVKRFEAVGIYVPFWTFDARVHSDWSAQSGTYYYVTEHYTTQVNGKSVRRSRQVRKTRWRPAWGQRDDCHNDHLVLGAKGQPGDLVRELGEFQLNGLVPYQPGYLAGWRAEEYSIDLEAAWALGQKQIAEIQRQRCSADVPGDTQSNLRVQNTLSDVRWKHILLPIWSLQYRFSGEVYTVLIHGQTGEVVGKAPYSWVKILLLILAVVVVGLVAVLLSQGA